MSADHTITTKNRTEEIAETTQKLLHDYFERSGSASLINRLAPDVLWFSEEESGGKEKAARYLTAWKEGFFNSGSSTWFLSAKDLGNLIADESKKWTEAAKEAGLAVSK